MPTTQVDAGGTVRSLSALTQIDTDGTVRTLQQLWQNDEGNTPRLIYSAQTLGISPTYAQGTGSSQRPISVSTNSVSVTGAPAAATFAWVLSNPDFTTVSPGQQTTAFRAPVAAGDSKECTVYCAVTYGSSTTNTPSITAYVENIYSGGLA
jgi:hypothetical protein